MLRFLSLKFAKSIKFLIGFLFLEYCFALLNSSYSPSSYALLFIIALSAYCLRYYINWSVKNNIIQTIRSDGPQSHLVSKANTPTMGGLFFLIPFYLYYWLFMDHISVLTHAVWASIMFGCIGLIDDLLKLNYKLQRSSENQMRNNFFKSFFNSERRGLYVKEKFVLQLLAAVIFVFMLPLENLSLPLFDVKHFILLVPFLVFVMIGTVNAVNLTDGLDGLVGILSFIIIEFIFSRFGLQLESLQFLLLLFLIFNAPKAKVFMGDVGAFGLGALIAGIFIGFNQTLLLAWIGMIFVIETLSVMLQVVYYKKTNKRLFKMAPIHHHFEHLGYSETKIVLSAAAIQILLVLFASQFF